MLQEKFLVFRKSPANEETRKELFAYIWQNYRKRISYYISNLIPRRHPGFDDAFQEIMVKIYNGLPDFDPAHSFKAWIYKISRNHCLDFLKSREGKMIGCEEIPENAVAATDTPEQASIRCEELDRIDRCLNALAGIDSEIAYLRFYEGMKSKDIGRIVGMNPGAVRFRIHWILKKIKNME